MDRRKQHRLHGLFTLVLCCYMTQGTADNDAVITYKLDSQWPADTTYPFEQVTWMQVDHDSDQVYLLQRKVPPVLVFTLAGDLVNQWDITDLGDPHSITLQAQEQGGKAVWITDMAPPQPAGTGFGHCIKKFNLQGELLQTLGHCGQSTQGTGLHPLQFDKVTDIDFDSKGNIYITDGDLNGLNNRLLKLTPDGTLLNVWSAADNQPGAGPLEFHLPHAVVVDECDRLWIADALNHRIQVASSDGEFYGELACFGDDGVYGLALSHQSDSDRDNALFVTTSPTDGENHGTVYVFDTPMNCAVPDDIGDDCAVLAKWNITVPPTKQTAMVHDITVTSNGGAAFVSLLGGATAPQKWVLAP